MPYRFFLIPILTGLVAYLGYHLYIEKDPNPWILFSLLTFSVATYVFQHQLNNLWWSRYTPDLEENEKKWLQHHLPYIQSLSSEELKVFYKELSKVCLFHEFIPMGNIPIHEELKWIILAPAIRLKLYSEPTIYSHFIRTVIYPHPFISPEIDQIHVSEVHLQDGILIFSAEQLLLSHLNIKKYFNPALYEWCKIYVEFRKIEVQLTNDFIIEKLENLLDDVHYNDILLWMGREALAFDALALYVSLIDESSISENYFKDQV